MPVKTDSREYRKFEGMEVRAAEDGRMIVEVSDPGITHYAADRNYERHKLWQKYEQMEWRVKDAC